MAPKKPSRVAYYKSEKWLGNKRKANFDSINDMGWQATSGAESKKTSIKTEIQQDCSYQGKALNVPTAF